MKTISFQTHESPPVSRRDFLACGLSSLATYSVMPTLFGLVALQNSARADECPAGGIKNDLPPFLVFDLVGGAALMGNWVPMDQGGSLLPSYSTLGLGTTPSLNTQFGAPMASSFTVTSSGSTGSSTGGTAGGSTGATSSQILAGILSTTTPECQASLKMGIIALQSTSDSGNNRLSALMHVAMAGYQGKYVRSPLGTSTKRSGGNSDTAVFDPTLQSLRIRGITDFSNAISYGPALSSLPDSQLSALTKAILNLSQSQSVKLAGMSLADQFTSLFKCGILKNISLIGGVTGIDPREDPIFQSRYNITTSTSSTSAAVQSATIVMNTLKGNSGPSVIALGGYDYHDGTQTTGDTKDLEAGTEIGRAIQAAYDMGKPLVFQILTDGGISSAAGTRNWTGDSNQRSLSVVGIMRPNNPASMKKNQVGYYTSGQVAATDSIVGADPATTAHIVFANYLSYAGQLNTFPQIVPTGAFDMNRLEEALLFG